MAVNIREVREHIEEDSVKSVTVYYVSGLSRAYLPGEVPGRIKDFIRLARTVKEFPTGRKGINRIYYWN